jgi:opacity protein-like surface antigen
MATSRAGIRQAAVAAAALLTATAAPATAQEGAQPRLFFTVNAGIVFGGNLWTVDKQPVALLGGIAFDTMRISRQLTSGLAAGLTATLYTSTHLGFSFEAEYLGQVIDDECSMVYESDLDPQRRNAQVCETMDQIQATAATTGFYLGANYRFTPRGAFSPYVRVQGGVSLRNTSVVEASGVFVADGDVQERVVIQDRSGTRIAPTAALALGVVIPLSPSYLVSFELRDHLIQMQRVTGPAVVGIAPTENFLMHAFAVTFGFSIVLEKKRGRRY